MYGKNRFPAVAKKRREKKEKVISPQREANKKTSRWEIREEERGNDVFIYQFMSFAISDFELSHNGNGKEERERWRNIEKRLYYFPPFLPFFSSPLTYFFAARSKIVPSFPSLPSFPSFFRRRKWGCEKNRAERERDNISLSYSSDFPHQARRHCEKKGKRKEMCYITSAIGKRIIVCASKTCKKGNTIWNHRNILWNYSFWHILINILLLVTSKVLIPLTSSHLPPFFDLSAVVASSRKKCG